MWERPKAEFLRLALAKAREENELLAKYGARIPRLKLVEHHNALELWSVEKVAALEKIAALVALEEETQSTKVWMTVERYSNDLARGEPELRVWCSECGGVLSHHCPWCDDRGYGSVRFTVVERGVRERVEREVVERILKDVERNVKESGT